MVISKLKSWIARLLGFDEQSKKKLFIRLGVLSGVFTLLIILARSWNSGQVVQEITVEGNKNISVGEITDIVKNYALNRSKSDIDMAGIKRLLESNPYILSAAVKDDGVKELRLVIKEREPVAMVQNREGELSLVGNDGNIMPYRLLGGISNLPMISGANCYNRMDTSAIRGAVKIVEELNLESSKPLDNLVSEICFDWSTRSYTLLTTCEGVKVHVGRAEDLSSKLGSLKRFWLDGFKMLNDLGKTNIDVRWAERVIIS